MARLFSIQFDFQNKEHIALVSVRESERDLCCQVRYTDKDLNNLLCGKQFVFNLLDGLKQPCELSGQLMQALFTATVDAIKKHLDGQPVKALR